VSELSEEEFRKRLADKGLTLDARAFAAALAGARHLRAEVARLQALMDRAA
jgi:hypothetical protein